MRNSRTDDVYFGRVVLRPLVEKKLPNASLNHLGHHLDLRDELRFVRVIFPSVLCLDPLSFAYWLRALSH